MTPSRRECFLTAGRAILAGMLSGVKIAHAQKSDFGLKFILASPLYGTTPIAEVLGEVRKCGANHIDLWPRVHADHREQVEKLGESAFANMLADHGVELGMTTRYDLGPF